MNIFLDTNAILKLYHHEAGSDLLMQFLRKAPIQSVLIVSDISRIEFHSAIMRRVRTKEIDLNVAKQILVMFDQDISFFHVEKVSDPVKNFAVELLDSIADSKGLRTLDAIQLAAAIFSHQRLPLHFFVTSDRALLTIAQEFFPVFDPLRAPKSFQ